MTAPHHRNGKATQSTAKPALPRPMPATAAKSAPAATPKLVPAKPPAKPAAAKPVPAASEEFVPVHDTDPEETATPAAAKPARSNPDAQRAAIAAAPAPEIAKLLQAVAARAPADPDERKVWTSMTLAQLDRMTFERDYLIDDILLGGYMGVVAGPAKALKTTIGIDAAISIATGTPFLGKFPVRKNEPSPTSRPKQLTTRLKRRSGGSAGPRASIRTPSTTCTSSSACRLFIGRSRRRGPQPSTN